MQTLLVFLYAKLCLIIRLIIAPFREIWCFFSTWIFQPIWRFISKHKFKLSLANGSLLAVLGAYYTFFIRPEAIYFLQLRDNITTLKTYAIYVSTVCDKLDTLKPEDTEMKNWLLIQMMLYQKEWAVVYAKMLPLNERHYRQTPSIHKRVLAFNNWNWEQIIYIGLNKSCPSERYTVKDLQQWETEIGTLFPNSISDFNKIYYEQHLSSK